MEQIQKMIREKAMQYAEEAFAEHEEQVFTAFDCIIACGYEARQSGLLALEEKAEGWKKEEGNKIPLKELLICMVQELVDASDMDSWDEKAYRQITEMGCSGYEWYIAEIYVTGCKQVYRGMTAAQYYQACRVMVPYGQQERFDSFWERRSKEAQVWGEVHIEDWAEYTFRKEAAVRAAFHKRFRKMKPEGLRWILKEIPDKILAAALAGAEDSLRIRFLKYMPPDQRAYILAEWYENRNEEYGLRDIEKAMERMTMAAGLMGEGL